ncbi:MAG: tRNA glutamyl-Q(34) synthetase GluQRS [Pseudomonadota bacterium]
MCSANVRERFAPSPTGPLHLGHAFSALTAFEAAERTDGTFLLRIEDIDRSRARPEWEALIYDDMRWLGLRWEEPVMRQSERTHAYRAALAQLWSLGVLYPCTCTRRDIETAASAPQEGAPLIGPDGIVYPGTCRHVPSGPMPVDAVLRLNMGQALDHVGDLLFAEIGTRDIARSRNTIGKPTTVHLAAQTVQREVGDVVLARRNMGTSYHLSVVVDDAAQGITHVTRGEDLFDATAIHVVLQRLLDLPTPVYRHHRLIRDEAGKRLAKRDDARAIRLYRAEECSPEEIRALVGLR